ncbi:unnamed protein product [Plutella xylostella]|uniref:(diamondback moth) hypothetical protein n=1 Tax=Plutella xylostella TaxID=51655 RepID=A0A8S4G4Z2_PLUXY|nr:unnamed protein product [Plutella xylostella]
MLCLDCNVSCGDGVTCSGCKKELCFGCANITERGYRNLGAERRAGWKCPRCRISSPRVQSPIKHKEASLDEIISRLDILTKKLDVLPKLIADVNELKSNMMEVVKSCEFAGQKIDDFESKLVGLTDRVTSLEVVKEALTSTQSTMGLVQQDFNEKDQWSRLNNVEIKGVPLKNNENLFKIVETLSEHLNVPISKANINFVSRVPVFNTKEKSILLGFVNRYVKEDFVAAARARKTTKACDIGFANCDQRIYINDHLSPNNKKLLSRTKQIARDKNYLYVWVKHAKIHIRKNDSAPVLTIRSIEDLNKLN